MLGAFVQENPLFAAIAGTVVLALVILIAGALVSHLFDRRQRSPVRHESAFDEGRHAGWGDVEPSGVADPVAMVQAPAPHSTRRSGFGFGVVVVAFLVGLIAGGAGIAVSSRSVATAVASLVDLVELDSAAVGGGPQASDGFAGVAPGTQSEGSPQAEIVTPQDLGAKLTLFAEKLKASLPRAAGPELSLTRVDLDGMRLSLGYAVGRVMAEDETRAFDAYILRTVKSLFCGRESREIRFLSENGVVFDMEYIDPGGRTITRLTVEPGFCA